MIQMALGDLSFLQTDDPHLLHVPIGKRSGKGGH